jgi:anti-anti-sigma factor
MATGRSPLHITADAVADVAVLTVQGVLDDTTYAPLRDAIVKAALDEPRAVIVDISRLAIRDESALAVFTSAHWQVTEWPNVPIGLACAHARGRDALRRNGVTRYVPVYPTRQSATAQLPAEALRGYRQRARTTLPALNSSPRRSRELTSKWLTAWSRTDFIHAASIVANELVENALTDTDSVISLRLETDGSTVTVVVTHASTAVPARESIRETVSGLDVVEATSRFWGSHTTAAGKTVWAVIGPENRF